MEIQQTLTKYISEALNHELPKETQNNTRFHLLDTFNSNFDWTTFAPW